MELLSLDHRLINWFTIKIGDWGHAIVRCNVLWILGFVAIATISSFAILAILLALSFLLAVLVP